MNCPCPDGWHIPTRTEWEIADQSFGPHGGWAGSSTGMVQIMGMPLA